jgi:hypothetical protein
VRADRILVDGGHTGRYAQKKAKSGFFRNFMAVLLVSDCMKPTETFLGQRRYP